MANNDLWGDFDLAALVVTPLSILKEQSSVLSERTKQLLKGQVKTTSTETWVFHEFSIVAPAVGNYRYELLTVRHKIDLYPVSIFYKNTESLCGNPEEFTTRLASILSNEDTHRIIRALLAQSV